MRDRPLIQTAIPKRRYQIGEFSGHNTNPAAVAFSPDGKRLVSAHDNTTLLVWDVIQFNE